MISKKIRRVKFIIKLYFADGFKKPLVYKWFYNLKMGTNIRFTGKINFGTEPFLVELGDDVTLAEGVTFHTHDGGVWVFRKEYPGINIYKPIKIGNNVFIGAYANILPGVTIGDNVIIGACSVVTHNVPPNSVYGGVPAKLIKSLDDYKKKALENAIFIDKSIDFKSQVLDKISQKGFI
jgi:acetyltransferase-like isoleucine patch superfamily enzyme